MVARAEISEGGKIIRRGRTPLNSSLRRAPKPEKTSLQND
jgi:hypothetical protein